MFPGIIGGRSRGFSGVVASQDSNFAGARSTRNGINNRQRDQNSIGAPKQILISFEV
jgi:hypothetical protein